MFQVKNIMTKDVFTLNQHDSLSAAKDLMNLARIRHIPIVDDAGRFAGLLTHRDILAATISELAGIDRETQDEIEAGIPIAEIMQTDVVTGSPELSLKEAARLLLEEKYGCLPVVCSTKLCGIINGQTLEPGVEWSINEVAGPRTIANGWKEADGISDGGYTKQAGGGVCQISSTLFNASIRSGIFYNGNTSIAADENSYKWGIEVTSWRHHSIISGYIPLGLDATISTGGPDLKLLNHCTTPFYIVSYMNTEEKCVPVFL